MEKTLIQCRVINLKWLMTKDCWAVYENYKQIPENKTEAGKEGTWEEDKQVFWRSVAV